MQVPVGESAIVKVHFPTWWPVAGGESRLIKLDVLDAMPYNLPEVEVENRPFYTPAQIAEMKNARIHSQVPEVDRLAWSTGDDSIPEADLVEPEPEVRE